MAYWVLKCLLSPWLFGLWRVKVTGRQNVPKRGPVILAPNHVSFCDSLFLPVAMRRKVTFVAKAEYFDSWRTAWFFRAAGQIPMRRDGGSASERALAAARDVLRSGMVLGIYPEGTRSPDGRLYRGHTGVARLALECGVPVVPVGIVGTPEVQPRGSMLLRPFRRVEIRIGAPLDLQRFAGSGDDPLALRALTDEVMFAIKELSGQEYVDRYAKRHDVVGGAETGRIGAVDPSAAAPATASFASGTAGGADRSTEQRPARSHPAA
jgi:1-acyl-sn-glycerol-3-phosphate acyltransferase